MAAKHPDKVGSDLEKIAGGPATKMCTEEHCLRRALPGRRVCRECHERLSARSLRPHLSKPVGQAPIVDLRPREVG